MMISYLFIERKQSKISHSKSTKSLYGQLYGLTLRGIKDLKGIPQTIGCIEGRRVDKGIECKEVG